VGPENNLTNPCCQEWKGNITRGERGQNLDESKGFGRYNDNLRWLNLLNWKGGDYKGTIGKKEM